MNIGKKSSASGKTKPKTTLGGAGGLGLLPPPPGGVKMPPTVAAPSSGVRPPPCSPATTQSPVSSQGVANLLDLSPPKEGAPLVSGDTVGNGPPPAAPAAAPVDPWGDFTSAAGPPDNSVPPLQPSQGGAWIQF